MVIIDNIMVDYVYVSFLSEVEEYRQSIEMRTNDVLTNCPRENKIKLFFIGPQPDLGTWALKA